MQDENRWFMCFRTEVSSLKTMPQLGHFAEDIEMAGRRRGKFPQFLSPNPQHTQRSTMDTPSAENFESLVPLIEKVNLLLPVRFVVFVFI